MTTVPTIRPALDSLREDVAAARARVEDVCALAETLLPADSHARKWLGEARTYLLAAERRLARDARASARLASGKPPPRRAVRPKPAAPPLPTGMRLVPRVLLPLVEYGSDYGPKPRFLLARRGLVRLYWMPSQKAWKSVGNFSHSPAVLVLDGLRRESSWGPESRDLHEGGRLSRALLLKHADAIDAVFGKGVAALIDPLRTLEIEP